MPTFNSTGAPQSFQIPANVTRITLDARGGQGGTLRANAMNRGARAVSQVNVTPGMTLDVLVGQMGQLAVGSAGGVAAFNGGGKGGDAVASLPVVMVVVAPPRSMRCYSL